MAIHFELKEFKARQRKVLAAMEAMRLDGRRRPYCAAHPRA
jgi:hypothetical protein